MLGIVSFGQILLVAQAEPVTSDALSGLGLESCGSGATWGHIPSEPPPLSLLLYSQDSPPEWEAGQAWSFQALNLRCFPR